MKRKLGVTAAAAALALGAVIIPTSVAMAAPGSGYQSCSGGTPYAYIRTEANGTVTQKAPGGSTATFINGSSFTVHITQGATGGGSWSWNTDRSWRVGGDYPYCTSYT